MNHNKVESHEDKLTAIVMESFRVRPMPSGNITASECQRRVQMTSEIWEMLFKDAKWSQQRIIDHMLQFLIRRIDGLGLPAEALRKARDDESTMWSPETSKKVEAENRLSALSVKNGSSSKIER